MKLLKKLLTITPLKLSLVIITSFLVISLIYDVSPRSLPIISSFDQKSIDIKFKFRGIERSKSKIIIVAGDDPSFQKFGQWPWDRATVFAPLLSTLCRYNPRAVGIDLVWSEHEKLISSQVRKALNLAVGSNSKIIEDAILNGSGDTVLRQAIERCGSKIVLGYAPSPNENQGLLAKEYDRRLKIITDNGQNILTSRIAGKAQFAQFPGDPDANMDFYHTAKNGLLNVPELTPPRTAQGFFTNEGDSDGNYRHTLLFYRAGDHFIPSLSLRMAQKALSPQDAPARLLIQPYLPEKNQMQDLRLELQTSQGFRQIPLDLTGKAIINYRGPNFTFPNISIAQILSDSETIKYDIVEASGELKHYKVHKSELFKDALVLVGITATALYDIRPRPLDPQATGVENHANILDNLINNDFMIRPTAEMLLWLDIAIFIISLIYGLALGRLNATWGALTAVASISSIIYFDQVYLFNRGIVFSGHLQAVQFLFQYIGITVLKYMQEESEKRFIRSAFDKYVSPAIVDSMLKDPSKLKLGGEKRELSILFSDIRGFTELSERVDVKALTQFLNEYLGAMTDILKKNSGTLDKYIGDAVMGFWGAPLELQNHASLAVKTAVEMLIKLDDLNAEFQKKYGFTIDIGIGINSGAVSVGNFGSSKVFEYTVIGDNVNLASRLEGINKYYGTRIIISEMTRDLLKADEFLLREVDTVKVKGKHKPVKIYEIFPDTAAYAPLKSVLKTFNEGLKHYYARQWEKAINIFKTVLQTCDGDKISRQMIERCMHYIKQPPQADWDGSWEMHSK